MSGATMIELMAPTEDAGVLRDALSHTSPAPAWHALWTRSHCERLVRDQLAATGFDVFLPTIDRWSRRGGLRPLLRGPMFPGHVFLHGALDKTSHNAGVKAPGLGHIL